MTDSIPLFALIFKPLTFWFSSPFQYFGIWTLSCFVLQAVFGWKLLALWVTDYAQLLLGTAFLVISPVFIDRLSLHLAIAGHWTILAALYLYFVDDYPYGKWLTLGCIATLVQPYLAMMVTVIYIADVTKQSIRFRRLTFKLSLGVLGYFVMLSAIAWQAGLFIFDPSSTSAAGYNGYSANGLTWVNPDSGLNSRPGWSTLVPNAWQGGGQYEGFSYLGTGLLVLSIVLFIGTFREVQLRFKFMIVVALLVLPVLGSQGISTQRTLVLLLLILGVVTWRIVVERYRKDGIQTTCICVASLLLVVFSLSNRVFLGGLRIATYPIPDWLMRLFSVFRASGRGLWPVTYLLSALIIASIFLKQRKWFAITIVLACLVFQVVESRHAIAVTTGVFSRSGPIDPFPASLWNAFGDRYSRIDVVHPIDAPRLYPTNPDFIAIEGMLWRDLGIFALRYHLQLNSFYFSREPTAQLAQEVAKLEVVVSTGEYRTDTLYVFIDSDMWESAKTQHRATDLVGILDGIPIVAPGLVDCDICNFTDFVPMA